MSQKKNAAFKLIPRTLQSQDDVLVALDDVVPTKASDYLDVAVANWLWDEWNLDSAFGLKTDTDTDTDSDSNADTDSDTGSDTNSDIGIEAAVAVAAIIVNNIDDVRGNLTLQTTSNNLPVIWSSEEPSIVSQDGIVTERSGNRRLVYLVPPFCDPGRRRDAA